MTVIDRAVDWALAAAESGEHGYDQQNRWGPDYDCSSFVITAYKKAGVPLASTYTGNMRQDFLSHGFRDVTAQIDLPTGRGLVRGDVLLNIVHHTALYVGGGQMVQATGNEWGGITGGQSGDQTGGEITVSGYRNFPWDCVLRFSAGEDISYTVRAGDTLWGIAERLLGSGTRWREIMTANGLTSTTIWPGQVLLIPGNGTVTLTADVKASTLTALEERAKKEGQTLGEIIDALAARMTG